MTLRPKKRPNGIKKSSQHKKEWDTVSYWFDTRGTYKGVQEAVAALRSYGCNIDVTKTSVGTVTITIDGHKLFFAKPSNAYVFLRNQIFQIRRGEGEKY